MEEGARLEELESRFRRDFEVTAAKLSKSPQTFLDGACMCLHVPGSNS